MCVLLLQYICKYIILHFIYIIIVYVKYYNVDTSVVESAFILVDKCSPILYHDVFIIYNLFGKSNLMFDFKTENKNSTVTNSRLYIYKKNKLFFEYDL